MYKPFALVFFLAVALALAVGSSAQRLQGRARLDSLLTATRNMREDSSGAKLMGKIGVLYADINPDSGIYWANRELRISKRLDFVTGMMDAYSILGNNYNSKGTAAKALTSFFTGLRLSEQRGGLRNQSVFLSGIGGTYMQLGEYDKALPQLQRALELMEQSGDTYDIEYLLQSLGGSFAALGNYQKGIECYIRALRIVEGRSSSEGISNIAGNLGLMLDAAGQYNRALVYKFRALRHATAIGDKQLMGTNQGSIGETYLSILADSTRAIMPDSLVPSARAAILLRAIPYLQAGIRISREAGYLKNVPQFYIDLSDVYTELGRHQEALEAYRASAAVSDSLKAAAGKEEIQQLETARALQLKDKDLRIAELEVAKKRGERAVLMAGVVVLMLVLGVVTFNFRRHERSRRRIKELQDHKISQLDEAVKRRTEQLGAMRQTIATDFHDQTGNMLAAIARQASILEMKLLHQPEHLTAVRSIISNSNELYASSKDFLWNLNHDSDDPLILLQYLSGYGQRYYNQFDISFSVEVAGTSLPHMQLSPFAGLNIIYIMKEAMSNVVKHSGADEVRMEMRWEADHVSYALQDNGNWKEADVAVDHYGLSNMQRRCNQSGFRYDLHHDEAGTRITLGVLLSACAA